MAIKKVRMIQHGLEATAGTLVPATFKWKGDGVIEFEDPVATPEMDYSVGDALGFVEGSFVSRTGSTLRLSDTDMSAETAIWLFNAAIKKLQGPASTFAFAFPQTTANALISTYTFELSDDVQEYEFGYGFCESFSIHGDVGSDNGRIKVNAVIRGRKAAPSTATASLGFLAAYEPLNMNYAHIKMDTIGTAAGTAAATTGFLKAFNVDVKTGWHPGEYADGRSALDFSLAEYGDAEITGRLKVLLNATGVTEIANARAGTPRVIEIGLNGSSSRIVKLQMPITYTEVPKHGDQDMNGLTLVEFPFKAGASRTATAQSVIFSVTASASTTVT